MRRFLSFFICVEFSFFVQILNAQLRVDSIGSVIIDQQLGIGTEPVSNMGLKLNREVSGTGYQYG